MGTVGVRTSASTVAPDIGYTPNLDKYLARVQRRQQTEQLAKDLPSGFPANLSSDLVWDNTIGETYDWTYELNEAELLEIEDALKHFQSLDQPLGFINQETFPLPTLHATLRRFSDEIHNGRGFKVLRGLPVTKHTRRENVIIYAGVSSHVADIRGRQDTEHDGKPVDVVLNHVKNMTMTVDSSKIGAPAFTNEKQVFHTDAGDLIALFCLEEAAEGGESKLSSSWMVYNELARSRPDLVRTLAEPWPFENFTGRGKKCSVRPLLHYVPKTASSPERMIIQYARRAFTGYLSLPRSSDIPALSEAQAEALDALHFLSEKHRILLDFKQGDIQYINNLSIFHAREGFTDTLDKQRHLIRLWLRDSEYAWPTPEALKSRWDFVYTGVTPENSVFPLEPFIRDGGANGAISKGDNANSTASKD
ncbi:Taurine hydroxylase-like protein SAT17 [Pseudocercospora fuligena]|uniref:Taurine hydroxylase-like protein SAT17 n=1 Tax=Pseudocercospora fuligena TaxID=685502 RepID=A0A8H6RP18_9PEZI|nr:Taurine hydroxylase-like protein SAT17 [Pseudocercospora fuligena]